MDDEEQHAAAFKAQIDEYSRQVEEHHRLLTELTRSMQPRRRATWLEGIRTFLLGLSLGVVGNIFGWGIQQDQSRVWVSALTAGVALLGGMYLGMYLDRR